MYKYENIELVPEIFAELLLQLCHNNQFGREEAIDIVKRHHLANGGKCDKKTYMNVFKRATLILRKKGFDITNPSYGVWRIGDVADEYVSYRDTNAMQLNTNVIDEAVDNQEEIGMGNEVIYVYYYPTYRKFATLRGQTEWACKVGMTTKNLWDRIYSQAATCFPEEPFVGLIIKCSDAHKLEQTIHNILKMRDKWIKSAPGKEWFLTSPAAVKEIYETIC